MAFTNIGDTVPLVREQEQPVPTPKTMVTSMPVTEVPLEVNEWLDKLGWVKHYAKDRDGHVYAHECWPGLFFEWSEAVSMEYMRFMTLGIVGQQKQAQGEMVSAGMSQAESPPRFG